MMSSAFASKDIVKSLDTKVIDHRKIEFVNYITS